MDNPIISKILKYKIYVKYVLAGGTAAATNLVALFALHGVLKLAIVPAASLAFCAAFFVSFCLQKFWTFRDPSRRVLKQMTKYLAVGLFNLVLNAAAMYVLVELLGVWYLLAQIMVGVVIAVESFLIYRTFIFKKGKIKEFTHETAHK